MSGSCSKARFAVAVRTSEFGTFGPDRPSCARLVVVAKRTLQLQAPGLPDLTRTSELRCTKFQRRDGSIECNRNSQLRHRVRSAANVSMP